MGVSQKKVLFYKISDIYKELFNMWSTENLKGFYVKKKQKL